MTGLHDRSRRVPRPWRPTLLAAVVAVTGLAACTATAGNDPGPSSSGTSHPSAATPASVVPVPPALDQTAVPALVAVQDSRNDPEDKRAVATVTMPGDPALASALDAITRSRTTEYEQGRSDGEPNELNIGWDPVLAAGSVLGIRVTTRMYTGGAHSRETTESVYSQIDRGSAWLGKNLLSDPDSVSRMVSGALDRSDLGPGTPTADQVTQDLRFGRDGSLVVVLDQGAVTPEAAGDVAVRLTPAAAAGVLSDAGRVVMQAARDGRPFTPSSSPTSPTDVTTSTPSSASTSGGGTGADGATTPGSADPSTAPTSVPPVTGPTQQAGPAVDCSAVKCIALTFDDGPGPYTQRLLDELAAKDVSATFFLIGRSAANRPQLARAEVEAGHVVGNHTYEHRDLATLDPATIQYEIDRTAAAIQKATGVRPFLLRPPYGATNSTVKSVARSLGYAQILWNVDTEDWKNRNVATTTQRALSGAKPGAIILMHDIHPTTVQAVPGIIDALRARGYTLVTVPELIGSKLTPGRAYFGR